MIPDPTLIPRPVSKCPNGTFNHADKNMCCCSDSCCWNNCSTKDNPPAKCLEGVDAFWMLDPRHGYWVAQRHKINITRNTSIETDIEQPTENATNINDSG